MTGWPALLGALGAVALLFGVLSAILALFQPVMDAGWVLGNMGVGLLLVGSAVVSSFDTLRERMHSGEARRVGRYGSSALVGSALTIVILGMIAFLSTRHSQRFDWTEQKINTLTDQTIELLGRLDRDVEMTAFFNAADAPPVRDLFDRYAHASDHINLQFADPNLRPDLIEAYGIEPASLTRGLVRIAVGADHLELDQFSESEVTNALLKLLHNVDRKVYFLEGHNERVFEGEEGDVGVGYAMAVAALRNETYEVEKLLLGAAGDVPADSDLVVIAGPTRPFLDEEHAALRRYLERGGALMVLLDPRAKTDLGQTLGEWGVVVGEDVVFDAKLAIFGQATSPFAARYETHPITSKLRDPVIFHMARSVTVAEEARGALREIVQTGEDSWAETGLAEWARTGRAKYDEADRVGPISIVVAGNLLLQEASDPEAEEKSARLVVIGDSDFASNELIGSYQNRDLFVNAANWLVDDTDQISLRPPMSRASRFQMTGPQFMQIQALSLFVLPEAIAVAGVLAWWMRRKRPGL